MTIASATNRIVANGNGTATVFSFSPMVITASTDLVVTKVDADGTEETLSEGASSTTYSVSVTPYPGTGSITYPASGGSPLASGKKLVMTQNVPLTQGLDLEPQGAYFPDNVEAALDRLTLISQQFKEKLDRALTVSVGSTDDPDVLRDALLDSVTSAAASAVSAAASAAAAAQYDIPLMAGYNEVMGAENLAVRTYADLVVSRAFTASGAEGYMRTVATGAKVIIDVEKNGVSIFSTKPEFAISANAMTAGVFSGASFVAGDRLTFKVTQIGSTIAGAQLMFTLIGGP